ncbi:hypothetical protein [Amycolatopsis methanolica]|uniref:hypothetical protein n=1 Tax=Amycolatopsis methanolica TaxID=1814 RepID=UPI00343EA972
MKIELPASPLAISVAVQHDALLIDLGARLRLPELWRVRAQVWDLEPCAAEDRVVGSLELVRIEMNREFGLLAAPLLGGAFDVIEDVLVPDTGTLVPELAQQLAPGPSGLVVVRTVELAPGWRNHDLYLPLQAAALRLLAPQARVAMVSTDPHTETRRATMPDPAERERTASELLPLLERAGFTAWRRVHLAALHDPGYQQCADDVLSGWFRDKLGDAPL